MRSKTLIALLLALAGPAAAQVRSGSALPVLPALPSSLGALAPLGALPEAPKLPELAPLAPPALEGPEATQAAWTAQRDGDEAVAALSQARAQAVLAKRGRPLVEKVHNPGSHHALEIEVSGVPESVRAYPAGGVFRHYTDKEGLEAILGSGRLQAGFVAYVQLSKGLWRKYYPDLSGLFLTLPDTQGSEVGVPEKPYWVDIRLPEGAAVLEVEKGKIFLVPMPGRYRDWMKDLARKAERGESIEGPYQNMIEETRARGGVPPDLSLPVEIVGSSQP